MPPAEEKHGENNAKRRDSAGTDVEVGQVSDIDAVPSYMPTEGNSLFGKLQAFAGKFGVEQRGIERVPNDERTDSSLSQIGTLVRLLQSPYQYGSLLIHPECSGFLPIWSSLLSP